MAQTGHVGTISLGFLAYYKDERAEQWLQNG
jgi:hypothetical protein